MGAQWKHAGRLANAAKRGAQFGKMVKEIQVAAKVGDPNPDNNSRLRAAVEAARKVSVPRDTIERAIKKGAGLTGDAVIYETIVYEGFTPHKVPVIVECLTDNKNRTASDVRQIFRKGQLGAMGSVAWMFDRLGVVEASVDAAGKAPFDLEGIAIEAGAQNVEPLGADDDLTAGQVGGRFFCDTSDLDAVSKYLATLGWSVTLAEMSYIAKTPVVLGETEKAEVTAFLGAIDDCDDVHRIYTALG